MASRLQFGYLGGVCGLCGLFATTVWASTPPDPSDAVDVWLQVRATIDGAAMESLDASPPAGVQLILRHQGRPLASTWAAGVAGHTDPVEHATTALLDEARSDELLARMPPHLINEGLRGTTLEADTAGPFEPLTATSLDAVADDLNPATDGVALRVGTHWHMRFPSALRMTGSAATLNTLHELAAVAGLKPETLREARRNGHAALYRFQTVDLVQQAGEHMPRVFSRGMKDLTWTCDRADLVTLLEQIVTHLGTHLTMPTTLGDDAATVLGSTYVPHLDRWKPLSASPRDRALARLAFLAAAATPGVDPTIAEQSRRWATDCSTQAAVTDDVAAALQMDSIPQPSEEQLARVTNLLDDDTLHTSDRAIAAWALAGYQPEHPRVRAFLDAATLLPPVQLVEMLPWLGWADIRMAAGADATPRLASFWNTLGTRTAANLSDSTTPAANMLPIAAFLATAAGDPDIWSLPERPAAFHAMCRSIRVLAHLVVGPDEARFFPAPDKMLGGVRLSPWDERMPIWAQSMAIMMIRSALQVFPDTVRDEERTP
jgi:hypothetical protein